MLRRQVPLPLLAADPCSIPAADTDGNPDTQADPTWSPLLFVNHPEYPGAHGCGTTAVAETMAAFFGTDKVAFSVESAVATVAQKTRSYERFTDAAKEVYDARTWGGLHFRNSTMEGAKIGRKVARYVAANFFRPVAVASPARSSALTIRGGYTDRDGRYRLVPFRARLALRLGRSSRP